MLQHFNYIVCTLNKTISYLKIQRHANDLTLILFGEYGKTSALIEDENKTCYEGQSLFRVFHKRTRDAY